MKKFLLRKNEQLQLDTTLCFILLVKDSRKGLKLFAFAVLVHLTFCM